MRRIIHGVGAALLLVLLLVGLPVLLVAVWPVGLPHVQLTPAGVWAALLRPDDGTLLLTLIKVAGWITWLILLISILTEIVGRLRHIRPRRLPGLALPQGIARGLIAATLALFLNTNTTIGQPALTAAQAAPLTPAPAAAPHQPAERHAEKETAQYERYTVKEGDTLSEIALDHLGNGHRYPEIFKASRHIHQPRGYRLTDPDVIDIGWTLNIPTDDKPAHKPTKTEERQRRSEPAGGTPSTHPSPSPTAPAGTVNPTQDSAPTGDVTASPADADADAAVSVPAWLLTGLAGAGAILAGALWIVLLRRRAVQHHHRLPGYVTAPAPATTLPVEKTLRYQGRPVSDLLTAIDDNLRRLAATLTAVNQELPALVAVAARPGQLELHLARVAALPEPWQSEGDHTAWRLTLADLPDDLDPLEPDGPAPWPHLATIGADTRGWWLINLEAAGITAIDGDPDYAADLARYLAAELATSPWSRDIQVDLIDIFEELAQLDPQRLRHHPDGSAIDDVIGAGVDTIDRLNHLQLDNLPAARATQAGDEIWLNRVLVTQQTTGHFGNLQQLLNDHPGHTAIATLIVGAGQTATPSLDITVEADGRVHIPALGLDLIANGITADEALGCVQLLHAADQLTGIDVPAAEGDGWQQYTDRAGKLRPDYTAPRNPDGADDPATSNLPEPDTQVLEAAATTSDDLAVLAPTIPESTQHAVANGDPTLDSDLADWFSTSCARPRLSILGPMRVRVGPTGQPAEAAKRKPYYTEIVAYLASRHGGATSAQLRTAFSTSPARIHRDLAVVRKWLGADATTGQRYLPDAIRAHNRDDGHGLYGLRDVLCDADLFRRLRLRGQTGGQDGLDDYLKALSLVSGKPYTDLRQGGGIWLADDRDDQHLLVAIVDTAHLAVTMALQAGDSQRARYAAEVAANAAPNEDIPKLDLAHVAAAEGDTACRDQLVAGLRRQRDSDGPSELAWRTARLTVPHRTSERRTG